MRGTGLHTLLIAANLALFALVAYVGAQVALTEWRGPDRSFGSSQGIVTEPVENPSQRLNRKPLERFDPVFAGDIFRTNQPAEPVRPAVQQPVLQETRMNLRLRGTVVGEESPSYAMIYDGRTRKEEMYRVDEYVQGVRIEGIARDGVILQGEKGRELLRLSDPEPRKPGRTSRKVHRRKRRSAPERDDQ